MVVYWLLVLSLVQGDESNGSIMQFFSDDTADSYYDYNVMVSNVEDVEYIGDEDSESEDVAEDEPVSFFDKLIALSLENQILNEQNTELNTQLAALQSELRNVVFKANSYRIDVEMEQAPLITEVTVLDEVTKLMRDEELAKAEASSEDDDEDDEIEMTAAMIFVISLGFMFMILQSLRKATGNAFRPFLVPALYTLFVDVSLLIVLLALISILHYLELFDEDYLEYDWILVGIAIFTLSWLLLGIWLVVAAQSFARVWIRNEDECKNIRRLTQQFNDAQMVGNPNRREINAIRRKFEYATMRQMFISPTVVPPVTESYLRSDFDFSEYLSRALAKTLAKVLQLNWLGYTFILVAMIVWRMIVYLGETVQMWSFLVIPLVLIILSFISRAKLRKIHRQLISEVDDEVISNFPRNDFRRSPEMDADIFRKPPYLNGTIHPAKRETNFIGCCGWRGHPLKLTFGYMLAGKFPNRHELLFWCDYYGVSFMVGLIQAYAVMLTLWISVIVMFYIPVLHGQWDWGILIIIVSIIVWLFMALYLVPENLRELAIVSSIEMKKDRTLVLEVTTAEKIMSAQMVARVYRQLKMTYLDRFAHRNPMADLSDHTLFLVKEMYNIVADPEAGRINISQLQDFLYLCGTALDNDELRLFCKECEPDEDYEFTEQGLLTAVAQLQDNTKLDARKVVKSLIKQHQLENDGDPKFVGMDDLKAFFDSIDWHLSDEDIEAFLWEVRWVLQDQSLCKVNMLASLVKTNNDMYPQ